MTDPEKVLDAVSNVEIPERSQVHPRVWKFLDYWKSLRHNKSQLPVWSDFDPVDIADLLPNVFLFSVDGNPPKFQFRLMGGNILEAGGPGRPGMSIEDVPSTVEGAHLKQILARIVDDRAPKWYKGPPTLVHHRQVIQLEGVMAPLLSGDGEITTIACVTVYTWLDGSET
jgi:hypothetical protein